MFEPPRCPHPHCPRHADPRPSFCVRRGFYLPKCRAHPVPRFRCKTCGKGFSRQTFRMDYRDHRPDLNPYLFAMLASGLGLRQSARILGLARWCTVVKFRKVARHLHGLNLNLRGDLPAGSSLQFDELETFEGRRNTRPLTLPVLIDRDTMFVIWGESAPIRPRGKMSESRKRAIAADERRLGIRRDESRRAIQSVLAHGAAICRRLSAVVLRTDEKTTYPSLARAAFGASRLFHLQTNSKLPRHTWNPLFPINHTEAMARDLVGRLRRESWLASKQGWCLDLQMQLFMAYRNYVRRRFNRDKASPAQILGFVPRRLTPWELLSWRQDWSGRSVHPIASRCESVDEFRSGA